MGPCRLWGGGRALALGPQGLLSKGGSHTFEDFTLVMVWRVDLGAGSQDMGQEASKRALWVRRPRWCQEMELGESHQNIRTSNTGKWKRCEKVLGRVRGF